MAENLGPDGIKDCAALSQAFGCRSRRKGQTAGSLNVLHAGESRLMAVGRRRLVGEMAEIHEISWRSPGRRQVKCPSLHGISSLDSEAFSTTK
jgi:hypothetical protein